MVPASPSQFNVEPGAGTELNTGALGSPAGQEMSQVLVTAVPILGVSVHVSDPVLALAEYAHCTGTVRFVLPEGSPLFTVAGNVGLTVPSDNPAPVTEQALNVTD